jgi:hypothetical protein
VLTEGIEQGIEAQHLDAEPRRPREDPFDFIQRGVSLAGLRENPRARGPHTRWPVIGVLAVHHRPLEPCRLAERGVAAAEAGQGHAPGGVEAPVVRDVAHRGVNHHQSGIECRARRWFTMPSRERGLGQPGKFIRRGRRRRAAGS